MYLLEQPLADQFAGSQCFVVLSSQNPKPSEYFLEVGSLQHFPEPPGISRNL
jgi:hypothetical protein